MAKVLAQSPRPRVVRVLMSNELYCLCVDFETYVFLNIKKVLYQYSEMAITKKVYAQATRVRKVIIYQVHRTHDDIVCIMSK